eukprot:TRINITY_DN23780_c0_g1_i2.p1 TRINITY_DN23780_c0_g1~~TRINITY_DN23780_c0_g1_i2.p1  ORF type:complete len:326 (+),score=73.03 TRINITY_DN23780_c0_g1_i2:75-1052(+)
MLRDDSIVSQFPKYLPTASEVSLAQQYLERPENKDLFAALTASVRVGIDEDSSVEAGAAATEATLMRFCWQARQDGLREEECAEGCLAYLRKCVDLRIKLQLDSLLGSDLFSERFQELYRRTIPFSFHGVSKHGHPVVIYRYGAVDVDALQQLWEEGAELQSANGLAVNGAVLYHMRAMEYVTKVVGLVESQRQGRIVDRLLAIIDVGGFGLRQLDSTFKAFLGELSKASSVLFPETLHATIVANAPWLLSNAVWPIAKMFLHPVTQCKIRCIAAGSVHTTLLEYLDNSDIPSYLGGKCSCVECTSGRLQGGSMAAWQPCASSSN